MNKSIDTKAPLTARKEISIQAPVEKVWNVQTDIEGWTAWQPDITAAKLEGALVAGSVFRWKAKGLSIVSTLHTVEPRHEIGWTGVSLGMYALHNWTFEAHGDTTRVISEESLSGWLTRLLKLFDPKFLEKSLDASLQTLKNRAESQ
ncbi:MAG: SRPBCC family protein [Caldilineaceae bacterium]|nr:SRPBCC family protein [Caldilineaceae bacterium]